MTVNNPDNVGWFVRARRKERGLSQAKLAQQLGMSREYLAQIESGKPKWPQKYISNIAAVLDVPEQRLAIAAGKIEAAPAEESMIEFAHRIGGRFLHDYFDRHPEDDSPLVRAFSEFEKADDSGKLFKYITAWRVACGLMALIDEMSDAELGSLVDVSDKDDAPLTRQVKAAL